MDTALYSPISQIPETPMTGSHVFVFDSTFFRSGVTWALPCYSPWLFLPWWCGKSGQWQIIPKGPAGKKNEKRNGGGDDDHHDDDADDDDDDDDAAAAADDDDDDDDDAVFTLFGPLGHEALFFRDRYIISFKICWSHRRANLTAEPHSKPELPCRKPSFRRIFSHPHRIQRNDDGLVADVLGNLFAINKRCMGQEWCVPCMWGCLVHRWSLPYVGYLRQHRRVLWLSTELFGFCKGLYTRCR